MSVVINKELGLNRGKKRIWLEGQKLVREGFEPGLRYDVSVCERSKTVCLIACEVGRRKVSSRDRNGKVSPIIDIESLVLDKVFTEGTMLRIVISKEKITIKVHSQYQKIERRESRYISKMKSGEALSGCSLFHGGGVLDKAVHAGLKLASIDSYIQVAVELEDKYLESSLSNNPELFREDTIAVCSGIELLDCSPNVNQEVDFLVAGIPCSGASRSGRSKNKLKHAESHEKAGSMFYYFLQFVERLNPAWVLIENVSEYASSASMEVIRSVLKTLGYTLHETNLNGNEFGALENRDRMAAIAVSKNMSLDLDGLVPLDDKPDNIQAVLERIDDASERWKSFDYLAEKEKRDKSLGKGFARQLLTGAESFCGTIGKGYAKCRSTEPFLLHPSKDGLSRLFTPFEHCSLKGIPREVIDGLSETVAHEVLGQSVIFPAFKSLAKHIGWRLKESSQAFVYA
ncbi:DNA cytosine methyltransferase [Vibrio fluvialis]|nr:DNA cytosine methyltransferase [Vibrio fluvialis]